LSFIVYTLISDNVLLLLFDDYIHIITKFDNLRVFLGLLSSDS